MGIRDYLCRWGIMIWKSLGTSGEAGFYGGIWVTTIIGIGILFLFLLGRFFMSVASVSDVHYEALRDDVDQEMQRLGFVESFDRTIGDLTNGTGFGISQNLHANLARRRNRIYYHPQLDKVVKVDSHTTRWDETDFPLEAVPVMMGIVEWAFTGVPYLLACRRRDGREHGYWVNNMFMREIQRIVFPAWKWPRPMGTDNQNQDHYQTYVNFFERVFHVNGITRDVDIDRGGGSGSGDPYLVVRPTGPSWKDFIRDTYDRWIGLQL